ncbi:MAG: RDD family protein [Verrucomicrobia bacterium]|nr:RDD family protein [Verrucomicrobiota bacterium]
MAGEPDKAPAEGGRKVTAETLTVVPSVLGRPLAEPWRRLAAMAVDLVAVALLSFLSKPFLGLGTGLLLCVLLGNSATAPAVLKTFRWICRTLGVVVILLSVVALGHSTLLRGTRVNLDAFTGSGDSAAMKATVAAPPDATWAQLRAANAQLQEQVEQLKEEVRSQRSSGSSWVGQARAFTTSLGVTFGWSGLYFTLLAGATNGRTLGKLVFRTRVVRINGANLTFFDAFIRNGGYIAGVAMGLIGFLKLLWEPNRQAVEDRIAGTVVVKQ